MTGKVIPFPRQKKEPEPTRLYDINTVVVDNSVEMMHTVIMQNLAILGYDKILDDDFTKRTKKDQVLLFEALKSLLLKYHHQKHAIQNLAEQMFDVAEDGSVVFRRDDEEEIRDQRGAEGAEGTALQEEEGRPPSERVVCIEGDPQGGLRPGDRMGDPPGCPPIQAV